MKNITILGSTGIVGRKTLEVLCENPNFYNVYALSAYKNISLLFEQIINFTPRYAVVSSESLADDLRSRLCKIRYSSTHIFFGENNLLNIVQDRCVDVVMSSIVGIAGLKPTYAAACSGKKILLANKESLVAGGEILIKAVREHGAKLVPVDSEHNAIFQCLENKSLNNSYNTIDKIILTASGGPFLDFNLSRMKNITTEQACFHPNWTMGKKISVDSATMVNKALEVIEAYWLFSIPIDKIDVLIHPQSIVHSIIQYCDGVSIANLSNPDMKLPILYSLFHPERRKTSFNSFLSNDIQHLEFRKLDKNKFRALKIVFQLLENKQYSHNIVFNAANEIFVKKFLEGKIKFLQILIKIEETLEKLSFPIPNSIEDILEIDQKTRLFIEKNFII